MKEGPDGDDPRGGDHVAEHHEQQAGGEVDPDQYVCEDDGA
eukprot:CAMPEP_0118922280 /NCGR_PEP_ID=MMETSP1169-20130426/1258_1 /TAXON_ID=36882 /ORGANISM="Pyramimonas obovata, Strain CCMP722" /LENGTH=40 /DNA_ID= /DNA_START= /DNA_END= /DNA_ORIENTATION=